MPSKSVTEISKFVAIDAVPELPGATYKSAHNGLFAIFQAKVCSLPPDPNTKTFIS
jgi:hypothetical protein